MYVSTADADRYELMNEAMSKWNTSGDCSTMSSLCLSAPSCVMPPDVILRPLAGLPLLVISYLVYMCVSLKTLPSTCHGDLADISSSGSLGAPSMTTSPLATALSHSTALS